MLNTVYSLVDGSLYLARVEVFDPPICLLVLAVYHGSPADQRFVQLFDDQESYFVTFYSFSLIMPSHDSWSPLDIVIFFSTESHYFDCGTFLQMRL